LQEYFPSQTPSAARDHFANYSTRPPARSLARPEHNPVHKKLASLGLSEQASETLALVCQQLAKRRPRAHARQAVSWFSLVRSCVIATIRVIDTQVLIRS